MKRSEMLEKIEQAIGNYALDTFKKDGNLDHINEYDLAIKILERIEDAGMLPPNKYPWDKIDVSYADDGSSMTFKATYKGKPAGVSHPVYEWDNE